MKDFKIMKKMVLLTLLLAFNVHAAVNGRYVRVEAPASSHMGLYEIEVWRGNANIALKNKELAFTGIGYRGRDINVRNEGRLLVDGATDFSKRSTEFSTVKDLNPWLELDFGVEQQLERLVIKSTLKPIYDDRSIRLISVLDSQRRVLWTATYDIRRKPFDNGVASFTLVPSKGPLIGRVVPLNIAQWAPLGDILEVQATDVPPEAKERAVRFAERNSPAAIEKLSKEFFSRMDLAKPELAEVKVKVERREFAAALDAYRDHFLLKLQRVAILDEGGLRPGMTPLPYPAAGDDLARGVAVVFARFDVVAQGFTPGTIAWAAVPKPDKGGLDLARARALAGRLQQPLLTAYRDTGREGLLAQWAAITDDWGMNIRADLDRAAAAGTDLRNYFVKDAIQEFNHLADELALTAKERPAFTRSISGATLARLLIPVVEEYPPAYWWACRRCSFNHTYNAMNAATITSRILDDFYAGERLDNENRQHWQRVWNTMMTRDGSMNEISDEGHLFMQWRMAAIVDQMKRTPPPWFTPDFLAEFETGWRQTTVYPLRHLAPDGFGHRLGSRNYDYFKRLWWLIDPKAGERELAASNTLDFTSIVRHPKFAGILQTVFGAGRERATLTPPRQEAWDLVTGYYGKSFTPPATTSDWMPYAGLWYLRRSWEPDATYVHMLCQPKGHPSSNGSAWNTEVHYFDYGAPLLALSPVWIDVQPPFNEEGTQTYKPGSKTETLTTASEFPIPARWHTSELLDYAESFYEGTYQTHREQRSTNFAPVAPALGESPVKDARADRRVILFRPARLLIVTDAVRSPASNAPRHYEIRQRYATPNRSGKETPPPGTFHGDARTLSLVNENAPGVTVRRFTTAKLSWDKRSTADAWENGAAMMNHTGVLEKLGGILRAETKGNLLLTALIEPHRTTGDAVVKSTSDLSAEGITGFKATLNDGSNLTWLNTGGEPRLLKAGQVELQGEGLLLYQLSPVTSGIALGCTRLSVGGKAVEIPCPDFEFSLDSKTTTDNRPLITSFIPIHRPIMPVTFSPQETVFTNSVPVVMTSATPGMEIRYTLDGREPDASSQLYTAPITINKDTYIRARAFRPGVKAIPFTAAGTAVTVISDARYYRRDLKSTSAAPTNSVQGLNWELVEGNWFSLFSHLNLPEVMPAKARGTTNKLLDVSMRQGDGPFGIRYNGFIDIPADGVWTFYAPSEYVGASCEPGYDLRLWIDGEEWDIGQRFHGHGIWSVPLKKGRHRLLVSFADARHRDRTVHNSGLWAGYPSPWVVWKGEAPIIEVSGPRFSRQPLPNQWLSR